MKTEITDSFSNQINISLLKKSNFREILTEHYSSSKKIIFVDENTQKYCLEYLLNEFHELNNAEIIVFPSGESNKTLEICVQVWEALSEYKIERKDLIINLGGGVVCDMGGFIASIFKRGLSFINIPTTLLAMVDASIGGKTGIDLGAYKNQLGLFSSPKTIYIDFSFLKTLALKEKQNAFAEMLKHGLIKSKNHWNELLKITDLNNIKEKLIFDSIQIKCKIVEIDPLEKNERKKLNFGHTFGHAIEGFLLGTKNEISHGHAVALGMICESYLSLKHHLLSEVEFEIIEKELKKRYKFPKINSVNFEEILTFMQQDKKNENGKIQFVLLKEIGKAKINQKVEDKLILDTLERYFI